MDPADRSPEALEAAAAFPGRERTLSRGVLLAGLAVMAGGMLSAPDRRVSPRLVVAWVAAFVVMKLVLLAWALRVRWRAWPALLCEALAFGSVGTVVALGLQPGGGDLLGTTLVVSTVVMLVAATLLRRRAAWQEQAEQEAADADADADDADADDAATNDRSEDGRG